MIEFIDDNGKYRRVTEYTMDEWNGTEWVTTEDYTPDEYWEGFTDEEFLEYLAGMPEPTVIPYPDDYEPSGPWPGSPLRRSFMYDPYGIYDDGMEDW